MRRLSLILLVALCALPAAAFAARDTTGDGVFEFRAANGTFTLTGKGVLWGQMDKGAIRIVSLTSDAGTTGQALAVSGGKWSDDPTVNVYGGSNLHFRVTGGKYKLRFRGTGLDLTAIGVGIADLSGSTLSLDPGDYAIDGGKWLPIAWNAKSVSYGVQPAAPPTGP